MILSSASMSVNTLKISRKVAFQVLAKDYFLVSNPLAELKGDTLEASKLPAYEAFLEGVAEEYLAKDKALRGQLTPGATNPRAGQLGRELQLLRRKGSKARARVEVAKWMKKQGIRVLTFTGEASGDMLALKNPQAVLEGETIELAKLRQYAADVKAAEAAYREQKAQNANLLGRQRGEGGRELARLGDEKRKAQARLEVAKQLKASGVSKVRY